MLTKESLGKALEEAIRRKGVTKADVARHFGVQPPSVHDWIKSGRIGKRHLSELLSYFADVASPSHWGLDDASPLVPAHFVREPHAGEAAAGRGQAPDVAQLAAEVREISFALIVIADWLRQYRPQDMTSLCEQLQVALEVTGLDPKNSVLGQIAQAAKSPATLLRAVGAASTMRSTTGSRP